MVIFDTNAILRYILQDNTEMANTVESELNNNTGNCRIPVEIVAEIVYVLDKVYKVDRVTIAKTIAGITEIDSKLITNKEIVLHAVHIYRITKLDFVDCLLAGYAKIKNYSIFTFDKNLKKVITKM